ncbi:hypothetical protein GCM10011490_13900 [Pseudoclavibacter endophyticus]|uniref:Na(+)/H(+) antiporter subunit C n=1 Tax=Pseudoclavibacter endophyticus TaxID=1778590 RepID=A0A6H9WE28_9MICO|nr:Na(+)/H(+) antiporter subunit C [Pseudoclavibacter endophyticus]KAB1649212.1 Na(+)/H(+) antiporter subunit C [Pseudoclavibacter endophyticus]GGA64475.1 hypothetical protein GCM10011490_13900 [Pseudoclavibacter endophyticus]
MTISILLLVGMVVCFAAGVAMLLERSLTRMVLGFLLLGNATNLLVFFMSGSFGAAPLFNPDLEPGDYSDPLPQAFILTAIVITFGVTAFLLALVYRSWRLAQADTVEDDEEDIAMRTVDVTADDETFVEADAGDTEFGSAAEAAVATATGPVDLNEVATADDHAGEFDAGDASSPTRATPDAEHDDTPSSDASATTDDPTDEGSRP